MADGERREGRCRLKERKRVARKKERESESKVAACLE